MIKNKFLFLFFLFFLFFFESILKESIQSIGSSLKKKSEEIKTGRFGVGFNSVYHLTDLPQFISDQFIIFFDPEATHLPNVNPSNPGKIINYIKNSKFVEKYRDQFTPLECFGCDLKQPFRGTTFRLPLRSVEVSCLDLSW